MRAVIIDDESSCHEGLGRLLKQNHPDITIVANAYNVKEGIERIHQFEPNLIFLDIEMPDGLGFDLLQRVNNVHFQLIFVTAHNQYAQSAVRFGALDYLLKPVLESELAEALIRARQKIKERISQEQLQILWEAFQNVQQNRLPTRIAIPTSDGIHYKMVENIIRMEANAQYTEFTLNGENKKILASIHLGEYAVQFEPYRNFMRVHRSHLVNLEYVDRFVKSEGGFLEMKDHSQVNVSRIYRDEVLKRLGEL